MNTPTAPVKMPHHKYEISKWTSESLARLRQVRLRQEGGMLFD
jgi:hypothetical protein